MTVPVCLAYGLPAADARPVERGGRRHVTDDHEQTARRAPVGAGLVPHEHAAGGATRLLHEVHAASLGRLLSSVAR